MIEPQTVARLHEIMRRESLSVLMYVGQAYPWTTAKNNAALVKLKDIIDEEREAINALGVWLTRRRAAPPWIGTFPAGFTAINFLGLEHILHRLIDDDHRSIPQMEKDLLAISDPEVREKVQALLDAKRHHVRELELLTLPHPAGV